MFKKVIVIYLVERVRAQHASPPDTALPSEDGPELESESQDSVQSVLLEWRRNAEYPKSRLALNMSRLDVHVTQKRQPEAASETRVNKAPS